MDDHADAGQSRMMVRQTFADHIRKKVQIGNEDPVLSACNVGGSCRSITDDRFHNPDENLNLEPRSCGDRPSGT